MNTRAAAGLLVMLALPLSAAAAQESGIAVGSKAPVLSVNDLDGKPVNLGQWIGKKPVLLEFWATWCENCEALLPRFVAARKELGDKVEFIGINVTVNQSPARVRRYMEQHQIPFRVLYDESGASTRAYEAQATSFVVIIDAAGIVRYTGIGAEQKFETALTSVASAAR
jgi:thiol-disulfide isomerase/thioredoxin